MKRLSWVMLALAFAASCTNISTLMDSWIGHTEQELILSWGPPQERVSDGADGTILVYRSYVTTGTVPGEIRPTQNGGATYTAPQTYGHQRIRMFYVHADGVIYSWRTQGL